MSGSVPASLDQRILILAPTGRDGELLEHSFASRELASVLCRDSAQMLAELQRGAGTLVIAEEALTVHSLHPLLEALRQQPPWSDLPIILLTFHGQPVAPTEFKLETLGNVIILERPVNLPALLSVVKSVLRTRGRQYVVREYLHQLEEVQESLQAANHAKDELLALVSHELRTPLTTIIGAATVLQRRLDSLDPETRATFIGDITGEAARLQRLIENMLFLSKAEGPSDIEREPILVQRILDRIAQASPGVQALELSVERSLPPVLGNESFFEQIILNLVRNSEKYSDITAPVELRATNAGSHVLCTVADRGRELSQAQVDQMFEPFFRDARTALRVSGLGLGLPVCKRLSQAIGATLRGQPRIGGGLVVELALPIYEFERDTAPSLPPPTSPVRLKEPTPEREAVSSHSNRAE